MATQANRRWIPGHCRHGRSSHRTVATSSGPRAHDHTTERAQRPGHGRPGTLTTIGCVRWPAPRVARLPAGRASVGRHVSRICWRITLCWEGRPVSHAMRLRTFSLREGTTSWDWALPADLRTAHPAPHPDFLLGTDHFAPRPEPHPGGEHVRCTETAQTRPPNASPRPGSRLAVGRRRCSSRKRTCPAPKPRGRLRAR